MSSIWGIILLGQSISFKKNASIFLQEVLAIEFVILFEAMNKIIEKFQIMALRFYSQ